MKKKKNFRQLDRSVRKQAIIDKAAEIFHKKGYESASLDDVSKALGITRPALYHYVKNKNELLTIIYTQAFENIFRDTEEISSMDLPPDEKLRRIIVNHITNIIMKDLSMFSVFFSEENQLPKKDIAKIREEKKRYTKIFERIVAEGMAEGVFKKTDAKLQAYAILGMCNWIYKWYRIGETQFSPEQIGSHFVGLLQEGYLARPTLDRERGQESRRDSPTRRQKKYDQVKLYSQKITQIISELDD